MWLHWNVANRNIRYVELLRYEIYMKNLFITLCICIITN